MRTISRETPFTKLPLLQFVLPLIILVMMGLSLFSCEREDENWGCFPSGPSVSLRFTYHDSLGSHNLFPTNDKVGSLPGYHADSVMVAFGEGEFEFILPYNNYEDGWDFPAIQYLSGVTIQNAEEEHRSILRVRAKADHTDVLDLTYRLKEIPKKERTSELLYEIDYVRIWLNGRLVSEQHENVAQLDIAVD